MPTENRSSNTEQMVKVPLKLTEQQARDIQRFYDTCEDGQGYDVPKDRMKSLARLGLTRSLGFGRYELTDAGDSAVNELRAQPAAQHQGDPDRALKDALFACLAAGGDDREYGGVATAGDRQGWVRFTTVAAGAQHQGEPVAAIPDGYCLMPRRLTAENGAKALLLGEFKLKVTRECPECIDLEEPAEGCEICDGEGEYAQRPTIPWEQIKFIYSEAVKGLALQPSPVL